MSRRALLSVTASFAAAVVLSACGGNSEPAETIPANALFINSIEGIEWEQTEYSATLTDGALVIASENKSTLPHNLNLKDANDVEVGAELDTPTKGDVDSSTYQLEPGTYTVFCKVVGHANMVATLIVK